MSFKTSTLAFLVGIGAVILGSRWYLSAAQTPNLTDIDAFMTNMKAIVIASMIITAGLWISVQVVFPKKSA